MKKQNNTTGSWLLRIMIAATVLSSMTGVQSCDSCNKPADTTSVSTTNINVDTTTVNNTTVTTPPASSDTGMPPAANTADTMSNTNVRNTDTAETKRKRR